MGLCRFGRVCPGALPTGGAGSGVWVLFCRLGRQCWLPGGCLGLRGLMSDGALPTGRTGSGIWVLFCRLGRQCWLPVGLERAQAGSQSGGL